MQIVLTGDVMLGRIVDRDVIRNPQVAPAALWGDVLPLLAAADLRLANLECVISARGTPWHPRTKAFHFRAHPRATAFLHAASIDAVTLANNHVLDYGAEALLDCLVLLDRAGIRHAGAGRSRAEALAAARLDTSGGCIAVVALTDNEPDWEAGVTTPGVNYVAYDRRGLVEPYHTRITQLLVDTRRWADVLIVSAHVGPNWGPPSPALRALAHQLIDLGADLYWGHSNHTPLGIECYQGRPIVYAAGDCVDDYAVDPVERNDGGFLFVVEVAQARVQRLRLYPTVIAQCRVRRAQGAEIDWLQERMRARSAALGTTVEVHPEWCDVEVR